MEEVQAVVIENGSSNIKAGFAGDDAPRFVFPSVVGRPKNTLLPTPTVPYAGEEARTRAGMLNSRWPVQCGIVNHWEDMEILWQHTFQKELRVNSEDQPVLLTEQSLNPRANREKTTEIMFESFKVPAFYLADQAVTALCASGPITGVVLESGDGFTQVVPIYQGHALRHAIMRLDIGGQDLTDYLLRLLEEMECPFSRSDREIVRDVKEYLCYVPLDFEQEMQSYAADPNFRSEPYGMGGGEVIFAGNGRIRCPELMFQPTLLGLEKPGVHELVHGAIMKIHTDIQKFVYGNIVLAGGNTMFPGFGDRLQKELQPLVPADMRAKVVAPPERKYSAWIGGSILSSMSSFKECWITKAEYNECGPIVVNRKCF